MDISVELFLYKQFIRSVDTMWLILILRRPKLEVANDLGRLKTCPEEVQVTWKFL